MREQQEKEYCNTYYAKNRDIILQKARERHKNKVYSDEQKQKMSEYNHNYYMKNRDHLIAQRQKAKCSELLQRTREKLQRQKARREALRKLNKIVTCNFCNRSVKQVNINRHIRMKCPEAKKARNHKEKQQIREPEYSDNITIYFD
jgi:phage FluMu protein Com